AMAAIVALVATCVILVLGRRRRRRKPPTTAAADVTAAGPAESSYERLRRGLTKTRVGLLGNLTSILGGHALDSDAVEELETALIRADVGVRTTERLLAGVRKRGGDEPVRDRLAA